MLPRVILILLGLVAQALGLPADQADPTTWGGILAAGGVVWATVRYLRQYALPNLDGIRVHLLAGAVGILLGVALGLGEILTGAWYDWALFGIQAAFGATVLDVAAKATVSGAVKVAKAAKS